VTLVEDFIQSLQVALVCSLDSHRSECWQHKSRQYSDNMMSE
jgi:hypothetical protein